MRVAAVFAFALGCASTGSLAQSPFDGTWKLEANSTHASGTRYDISLQDGLYSCRWCSPAWTVPADGGFHPVVGQSRYDETSVQVIDASTAIFTRRKDGRTFYRAVDVVSQDGNFLAFSYTEAGNAGTRESGIGLWTRLSPKPAGAHPVTGEWRELWVRSTTQEEVTFTIRTQGDIVRLDIAAGQYLVARFDGPAVPIEGDPRGTMASLHRVGEQTFVQRDRRLGQVVSVTTSTLLSPTMMEIVIENPRSGSTSRYTARRR